MAQQLAAVATACQPAQTATTTSVIVHVVQRGDTLFRLALRFGVSIEAIKAANGLKTSKIVVGQKLLIPVSPKVCPTACVPVCPTPVPTVCVPACPTPVPTVCVPVCPTPEPPVCVPVRPPGCVPACPPPCPPACVPVCPAPPPPVCVPVAPQSPKCVPVCPPTRIHIVRRGDDIFRLAAQFNVSVTVLMKANGLTTTTLKAGQTLIIPDP